ncbi:alpha-1,2-fucosyltransferase [Sedimentitalea sp.]|uniref:alpha-1,2-fucosyltransferase n=1 Tax=Sedimentitalea sp. TaxID=2048915 RepID=UPI0032977421
MITTRLHGRLGNQMFQYAAARGLAARYGAEVALDARLAQSRGEGVLTRVFDFPLSTPDILPPLKAQAPLRYAAWRLTSPRFRRENGLGYNPAFENFADGSYLHGYWQSERYFADVAEDIRRDFAFPPFSSPENAKMAARIGDGLSIALHVRRGDYLSLGAHTLCDQAYYDAALARVIEGLEDSPTVYVFSDDPDWVKDNLPLPCTRVVVDINGSDTDFEDMRLMSLCDHNIIGNSSFSWWGAWLNTNPGKRIAGPAQWFGDPKLVNPDILPDRWLKIAV